MNIQYTETENLEYSHLGFRPKPGCVLVQVKKEGTQKVCGVLMPQEKSSEDSQMLSGTIVSMTPGDDSKDYEDFYSLGDVVCFKEWSAGKIPLRGKYDTLWYLVSMKDLSGILVSAKDSANKGERK